jgi:thiol-disulfide isomerase/thioredoxin
MATFAVGALACLAIACAQTQRPSIVGAKEGDKSVDINTSGSDGKTHTVKSLTEKGPVYLLFVKSQCSANPFATPFFKRIHEAYKDKVNFVGVINTNKEGHQGWKDEFRGEWMTLLDPNKKIISGFGVKRSTPVIKIGKDGKVEKVFNGWGQDALKALAADIAKEAGTEKAIKLDDAPSGSRYG